MSNIEELSFEQAYGELEEIVARLESGELTLEDSVSLFERGRKLSERCQAILDQAELRITQLTDDGESAPLA
jgi:exodeoxyribonuclease VII small subunit